MKIKLQGVPQFEFELSVGELSVLLTRSAMHYDARCRSASSVGGFLHGWANTQRYGSGKLRATWDELDTCCKIIEFATGCSEVDKIIINRLSKAFRKALHKANVVYSEWTTEFDTDA